jgi:copper chaperone
MKVEEEDMKTILRSSELSCPSCVAKIEKALRSVPGVTDAHVHFETARIDVDHDASRASVENLLKAVRSVGYDASPSTL